MTSRKDMTAACLLPLLYLNMAGLAAGAGWLAMLSQWHVFWLGIVAVFLLPYAIPVLMLPAGIFSHFMVLHHNAGRRGKERLMYIVSTGYIISLVTLLCAAAFDYVTKSVHPAALGAALLWAASSALLPLLQWASRDVGNVFIATIIIAAQIATLTLCVLRVFFGPVDFVVSFAVLSCLTALMTAARIFYEDKKPR